MAIDKPNINAAGEPLGNWMVYRRASWVIPAMAGGDDALHSSGVHPSAAEIKIRVRLVGWHRLEVNPDGVRKDGCQRRFPNIPFLVKEVGHFGGVGEECAGAGAGIKPTIHGVAALRPRV